MKDSIRRLCTVAASLAIILARADPARALGCYSYETDYFGYDIQKILEGPATESVEQCQQACQANNLCAHWTYVAQRKQCYLKDNNAVRTAVSNPLAISGPRACPEQETETCFEYGVDFYGYDMEKVENGSTATPEACQQLCRAKPACTYWTYTLGKNNCYLKSGAASHARMPNPDAISGPSVCNTINIPPQQNCQEKDVDYAGHDIHAVNNHTVESPEKCHALCGSSPNCHFWTWVSSQRNCYLKNENALSGRTHVPGCVSGRRTCSAQHSSSTYLSQPLPLHPSAPLAQLPAANASAAKDLPVTNQAPSSPPMSCHEVGVMYGGMDLVFHHGVPHPETCQELCQKHAGCEYFTYFTEEKKCALKAAKDQVVHHPHVVSGAKLCTGLIMDTPTPAPSVKPVFTGRPSPPPKACHSVGVMYTGLNLALHADVTNHEDCQRHCLEYPGCAYFTHFASVNSCALKATKEQTVQHAGAISGEKFCSELTVPTSENITQPTGHISTMTPSSLSKSCHDAGVLYLGGDLVSHLGVADPEACQQLCQQHSGCMYFTFLTDLKRCTLKTTKEQMLSHNTAISGAKSCTDLVVSACMKEDVEIFGRDMARAAVSSASACEQLCHDNVLCASYSYNKDVKLCIQRQQEGPALGAISGYQNCQVQDGAGKENSLASVDRCYSQGFALTGPGVGILDQVASPEECQQACRGDFLCWAFTYSSKEKKCLLQAWGEEQIQQIDAVSGLKYCASTVSPPPRRQCYLGDYELYGKELNAAMVDTPQTCRKLCQANSLCAFWTFKTKSKTCSQKQGEAFSLRTASGYKHCWS